MQLPKSRFLFGLLALGAGGGLLAAGCGQTDTPVGAVHPVVGAPCAPLGAHAPADDGCNQCTCETGGWACTEESCTACTDGEVRQNDCNVCGCIDGQWTCTTQDCSADCTPGETSSTGCQACFCEDDGSWTCTANDCACEPGYADCNDDPADACETFVQNDDDNCGECGQVCALPNTSTECVEGTCASIACAVGFAECNADPADGCETNIADSVDHCGLCGLVCASEHGSASCNEGSCEIVCDAGYADCDASADNGCEVNTDADVSNCGQCGVVCAGAGAVCVEGECGTE